MSNFWNVHAVRILDIHTQSQSHTHRTSCVSRSGYKGDPQRATEQNCKSVLCLKHTHGGTDGQRERTDVGRDMIRVLNVHTSGVSSCVLMSVSFSFTPWLQFSLFIAIRGANGFYSDKLDDFFCLSFNGYFFGCDVCVRVRNPSFLSVFTSYFFYLCVYCL